MAMMEGYDYDEYQVYVNLPYEATQDNPNLIEKVILAGMEALGMEPDTTLETNWIDSHYI